MEVDALDCLGTKAFNVLLLLQSLACPQKNSFAPVFLQNVGVQTLSKIALID